MAIANDLQALINKSRREVDLIEEARGEVQLLNSHMEQLFYDLNYHETARRCLAGRLVDMRQIPVNLPAPETQLSPEISRKIAAQLDALVSP